MTDVATTSIVRREAAVVRFLKAFLLLRESPVGMIGAGLVLFWFVLAILAPVLAPFEPNATIQPLAFPGAEGPDGTVFLLGTDHIGRDILSRIIWGSQRVLFYSVVATFCAYVVGTLMGLAAGYMSGRVDDILSFVSNVILSFPVLVLYIVIISTIGASGANIIIAVTFASGPGIMRIVRGLVLDLKNRDYIFAAQTRGEGVWRIMLVELLPNARGPLIVDACLRLGYTTITIGTLGFLGLGLPPPDPDWGGMISETRQMAMAFPHMSIYPALAIVSLVLGFNLLADGLREISLRD
jgi:peptide/nickel transport system permease protein